MALDGGNRYREFLNLLKAANIPLIRFSHRTKYQAVHETADDVFRSAAAEWFDADDVDSIIGRVEEFVLREG